MRVIGLKPLKEFWGCHNDAETLLRLWYKTAKNATWSSLQDVRRTFPHADGVKTKGGETLTVFNISGNKFRLVCRVRYDYDRYDYELINVRNVLTHKECDEGQWKE